MPQPGSNRPPTRAMTGALALAALLLSPLAAVAAPRVGGGATVTVHDDGPGAGLWLHVSIDQASPDTERVRVNLPLSFVETAARLVPGAEMHGSRLRIDDVDLTVAELRQLWRSLDRAGDATLVETSDPNQRTTARRRGGYLVVETEELRRGGSRVEARNPETVIEALLSGTGEDLDLAAALRALAAHGAGELVAVDDHESRVRIWVDDRAESRREGGRR